MDNLTLPIYLNQKYVFDLLAMIDDGFSQVETIKTGYSESDNQKNDYKGDIGLSNVFAFLKFGATAERSAGKESKSTEEISKEKYHTPNSLFSKLRTYLQSNNSLLCNCNDCKPGNFVELQVSLRKNPLVDNLESLTSIVKMYSIFSQDGLSSVQAGNTKSPKNTTVKKDAHLAKPIKGIEQQIELLTKQLKSEGCLDLIGITTTKPEFKVVLTLDRSFLNDESLSDILDGSFRVLGKVTRVITESEQGGVNLLRKTGLSKFGDKVISQFFEVFNSNTDDFAFNNTEYVITPPVVQLIPIAIFT